MQARERRRRRSMEPLAETRRPHPIRRPNLERPFLRTSFQWPSADYDSLSSARPIAFNRRAFITTASTTTQRALCCGDRRKKNTTLNPTSARGRHVLDATGPLCQWPTRRRSSPMWTLHRLWINIGPILRNTARPTKGSHLCSFCQFCDH